MALLARVALALVLAACSASPPSAPASRSPSAPASPTSSARAAAFTFAVKGDWGLGGDAQRTITRRMCRVRDAVGFDVVVTTGDNFYEPDGRATDRTYFEPERCLYEDPDHVWRATWGNHDVAGRSTGSVLGATPRYYSWSSGGADFFMLDSNGAEDPAQRSWLERGLRGSAAAVKIAVLHHAPYTAGDFHRGDRRVVRNWVPLFERFGVTMVLAGHQHTYEHHVRRGVHYVVSGGGGGALYGCDREPETLLRCEARHHFLLVRVRPSGLSVEAVDGDGSRIDAFSIPI